MSATSRRSPTPPPRCWTTSSDGTSAPAAWCTAWPAYRSAPRSSWKSSSRWQGKRGKEPSRGTPDGLSHDTDQWALHLLPGGRPARRAGAAPTTRTALVVADVRAALRPAVRRLPPGRARLPGLRTQRLAGPEIIRVHVRSPRRDHDPVQRGARTRALHALYAGLWRPGGLSHGPGRPGPDRDPHRPGRGGAQRRPGRELAAAACV